MSTLEPGARIGTCSNDGCNSTVYVGPSGAETHVNNKPCPKTGQWATNPKLDTALGASR